MSRSTAARSAATPTSACASATGRRCSSNAPPPPAARCSAEPRQLLLQGGDGGEAVARLGHAGEDVVGREGEVLRVARLQDGADLVPGDRGGDGGALAGAQ